MPSAPISQKTPATPIAAASKGPATSESTNEAPMLMPMANIARVRDSGRVRSARNAVTGPDTAPRPCTTRAATSAAAVPATAPSAEPATCRSSPTTMSGLRPTRSDQTPKGICITACVSPYAPTARPARSGVPPGNEPAWSASTGNSRNSPNRRTA